MLNQQPNFWLCQQNYSISVIEVSAERRPSLTFFGRSLRARGDVTDDLDAFVANLSTSRASPAPPLTARMKNVAVKMRVFTVRADFIQCANCFFLYIKILFNFLLVYLIVSTWSVQSVTHYVITHTHTHSHTCADRCAKR